MVKAKINREGSIRLKPDNTVEVNKHKTVSPYNSAKHLKYAKLPAECNKCIYRSEEEGGNGRCPKYEKDAACAIRKDIKQFLDQINTGKRGKMIFVFVIKFAFFF